MEGERLVPIGRFSLLTRLSVRALRLYDKLGLLVPARVDPETGYRFYALSQTAVAGSIRILREMDMPLDEVRAAIADRTAVPRLLDEHKRRLDGRIVETKRALLLLTAFQEGGTSMLTPIEVREVATPSGLTVEIETSLARIGLDLGPAYERLFTLAGAAALQPAGPVFAAYVDQEFDPERVHVVAGLPVSGEPRASLDGAEFRSLDGGRCVVTTYVGPYEGIQKAWDEAWAWLTEHGHAVRGAPFETYRIGPGDAEPEHFETDIAIPIE